MNKNNIEPEYYPSALTIAGSDSGGGAGIQADLRTFNALGVYGCTAITALTSQNPRTVSRIDAVPPAGVVAQIDAVMSAIAVTYAKSGMLFCAETVEAVAAAVKRHRLPLVCDPVMISTSGAELLDKRAAGVLCEKLLREAAWLTPNLAEAELIAGRRLSNENDMRTAARELYDRYGATVVLKGGHCDGKRAGDVICREGKIYLLSSPRLKIEALTTHGTGCTLSAALAAALALRLPWDEAVCEAKAFVLGSLREHVLIGKELSAMYPPTADSIGDVRLEEPGSRA